jgi:ssDNA-binding Zn-finger/Zn-ribbon topoisomerase 1
MNTSKREIILSEKKNYKKIIDECPVCGNEMISEVVHKDDYPISYYCESGDEWIDLDLALDLIKKEKELNKSLKCIEFDINLELDKKSEKIKQLESKIAKQHLHISQLATVVKGLNAELIKKG